MEKIIRDCSIVTITATPDCCLAVDLIEIVEVEYLVAAQNYDTVTIIEKAKSY